MNNISGTKLGPLGVYIYIAIAKQTAATPKAGK